MNEKAGYRVHCVPATLEGGLGRGLILSAVFSFLPRTLGTRRDSHIRMWNLIKGKCSYTAKLEVEGEVVSFTPGGEAYALLHGNKVRAILGLHS